MTGPPGQPGSNKLQYLVSWSGTSVGIMEGDDSVPTIECTTKAKMIDRTDRYGDTEIDGVYTGATWGARFVCEEFRAGSVACLWPYGTYGLMGVIARLLFGLSAPLVLTSVAGTPAASGFMMANTVTASRAIIRPGFTSALRFGPVVRTVPVNMIVFPADLGGGVIGWVTST